MDRRDIRVAELISSISLATDLGTGQPMEHGMRTCLLAQHAGIALGLEQAKLREVYYVSLLRFLGCTSEAADDARFAAGSELDFYAGFAPVFMGQQSEQLRWLLSHLGAGRPALERARLLFSALTDTGGIDRSIAAHCEAGQQLGGRLGMDADVVNALGLAFERWDGKGYPNRVPGTEIPASVRISMVARDAELLFRAGGHELATETLTRRSGRAYDPEVVDVFLQELGGWIDELAEPLWDAVLDAEPFPHSVVSPDRLEDVLAAFADFVDLKCPYTHGHSSGVAQVASDAGSVLGLDDETLGRVRLAALAHDLGRVGVSNWIWDRPGPLSTDDWERVRLHPYYTERILARCSLWSELATAASHHERLDGSGYHRGCGAPQLSTDERLLAVADVYQALTQARPHRPARSPADAVAELAQEVELGRLDGRCVRAVAEVAGHERRELRSWPAGLTDREVDVLRLIAKGLTTKEIAARLVLAPKTVGRHVEHIYDKIGVRTRSGAALFTMEHGLAG